MADNVYILEYRKYATDKGTMIVPVFKYNGTLANDTICKFQNPFNISLLAGYNISDCLPLTGDGFSIAASGGNMITAFNAGGVTLTSSVSMPKQQYQNYNVGFSLITDNSGDHFLVTPYGGLTVSFQGLTIGVQPTPSKVGQCSITQNYTDQQVVVDATHITIGNYIYNGSVPVTDDPYDDAGTSGTGGGGGSFDDSGDDIPIPNLPALSAANAGFITLFNPSVSQLNSLADYMWTNAAFDVANFKKIFEDPMDCILGLSIVPISVTTSGNADVAIGNMLIPSIQFPVVSSQYQEFDCGSIPLTNLFFGGYLDYEPYTKIQIVVPYCGTFQISADDVIGKTINLVYHIDVLTGSCVAMLKCGNSVLYQFNGSCAVNIPINSINYASTIENATRIAVAIGTTVATAGAAAPAIMAGGEAAGAAQATLFNSAINTAGATAEGALSMKPSIERSGALSSSSGMMSVQTPYIVITRPRICLPLNQNKIKGYPSYIGVTLGDLTGQGYTEFDSVILSGLFLTDEEKGELDNILRSGVYL